MEKIRADFDDLREQSCNAALSFMGDAQHQINKLFGEGYAEKNPQLMAAYMQAAATEFHAMATAKALQHASGNVGFSLDSLVDAVRSAS